MEWGDNQCNCRTQLHAVEASHSSQLALCQNPTSVIFLVSMHMEQPRDPRELPTWSSEFRAFWLFLIGNAGAALRICGALANPAFHKYPGYKSQTVVVQVFNPSN